MDDFVTDEMVETAARAIDHAYNPERHPILAAMFRDYARAALEAAAPHIAAATLRDAKAKLDLATRVAETTTYTLADVIRAIDLMADELEADRLDRMERTLRSVMELAESWRYKGEFGFDDGSHAYGPDPEGEALDRASAELVSKIQEVLR